MIVAVIYGKAERKTTHSPKIGQEKKKRILVLIGELPEIIGIPWWEKDFVLSSATPLPSPS